MKDDKDILSSAKVIWSVLDLKPVGPSGQLNVQLDFSSPKGKTIRVSPSELRAASQKLSGISENYTSIYTQLMMQIQTMGSAWEGADNLAFVEQISDFCEELNNMADKLNSASNALRAQAQNYENRKNDIIAQSKKLTN